MRTSATQFSEFYGSALGHLVQGIVREKLSQAWNKADRLRVVGVGHTAPLIDSFENAERLAALVPEGIGAEIGGNIPACLIQDHCWPLPDASVDRLLIFHGLEEVSGPRRFLREAWRVLANDGLMIVACANRRGPWSMAENTPFAAGRPYSRRQLDGLLKSLMFQPTAYATALHFPPSSNGFLLRVASTWERVGATVESWNLPPVLPNLAGINFVEARKTTALPAGGNKAEVFRPGILMPGGMPSPIRRQGRLKVKSAASADRLAKPGRVSEN